MSILDTLARNESKIDYKLPNNAIADVLQIQVLKSSQGRSQIKFEEGEIDFITPVRVTGMQNGFNLGFEAKCLLVLSILLKKLDKDPTPEGTVGSFEARVYVNDVIDFQIINTGELGFEIDAEIFQEELKERLHYAHFAIHFDIPKVCLWDQMCINDIDIFVRKGIIEKHIHINN